MSNNLPTLLPGIKPPAMPTFAKFAETGIFRVRRHFENDAVLWDVHVDSRRLIPRDDCPRILAEIEAADVPASKPVAARLTKLMLGAWPSRELTDPDIFVSVLTLTFSAYPGDVALAAIDALTQKSKWLPSRAELLEALNEATLPRRFAANVVKQHIQHHAELDRQRDAEAKRLDERRQRYVAEPWIWLSDTYGNEFGCADNDGWLSWLKAACNEFGVRTVEEWHDAAREAPAKPDDWLFLRKFLDQRATQARQEEQQA